MSSLLCLLGLLSSIVCAYGTFVPYIDTTPSQITDYSGSFSTDTGINYAQDFAGSGLFTGGGSLAEPKMQSPSEIYPSVQSLPVGATDSNLSPFIPGGFPNDNNNPILAQGFSSPYVGNWQSSFGWQGFGIPVEGPTTLNAGTIGSNEIGFASQLSSPTFGTSFTSPSSGFSIGNGFADNSLESGFGSNLLYNRMGDNSFTPRLNSVPVGLGGSSTLYPGFGGNSIDSTFGDTSFSTTGGLSGGLSTAVNDISSTLIKSFGSADITNNESNNNIYHTGFPMKLF